MEYPDIYSHFNVGEHDKLLNSMLGRAESIFQVSFMYKQVLGLSADEINGGVTQELLETEPLTWIIYRDSDTGAHNKPVIRIGFGSQGNPEISFGRVNASRSDNFPPMSVDVVPGFDGGQMNATENVSSPLAFIEGVLWELEAAISAPEFTIRVYTRQPSVS